MKLGTSHYERSSLFLCSSLLSKRVYWDKTPSALLQIKEHQQLANQQCMEENTRLKAKELIIISLAVELFHLIYTYMLEHTHTHTERQEHALIEKLRAWILIRHAYLVEIIQGQEHLVQARKLGLLDAEEARLLDSANCEVKILANKGRFSERSITGKDSVRA